MSNINSEFSLPLNLTEVNQFFSNTLQERFQCFGCSSFNSNSLKGKFYYNNNDLQNKYQCVYGIFPPVGIERTSFPGIVHGGILSSIIDDTAYWTFFHNYKMLAVTSEMTIKYLSPCSEDTEIVAKGFINNENINIEAKPGNKITINVSLYNNTTKKNIVNGTVSFFILPKKHIIKVMGPESEELLNKL